MRKLILLLSIVCVNLLSYADTTIGGITYMLMNDNTAWVTTGNYAGNIVIPEQIEYNSELYSVTVIYSSAFKGCSEVTNVDLPSSITSIESSAFESCTSLKSIVIPENVTNIGANSFYNCN